MPAYPLKISESVSSKKEPGQGVNLRKMMRWGALGFGFPGNPCRGKLSQLHKIVVSRRRKQVRITGKIKAMEATP